MARDNFLIKKNNHDYQLQKLPTSVYFEDISKKSPESNWQYKNIKSRYDILTQEHYNNQTAWQIDI